MEIKFRGWFTNKISVCDSLSKFNSFLYEKYKDNGKISYLEVFDPDKPKKMFFDIDVYVRDVDISQDLFQVKNEKVLHICKTIISSVCPHYTIIGIATSSKFQYNNADGDKTSKISYTIVLNCTFIKYSDAISIVKKCNKELKHSYPDDTWMHNCFDEKVYKLGTLRTVYSSKPHEDRPKNLLYGSFNDLVIQEPCDYQHISVGSNIQFDNQNCSSQSVDSGMVFSLLYEGLTDDNVITSLSKKMDEYDSWNALAMYFVYIIDKEPLFYDEACELFYKISALSDKFDKKECDSKINILRGKVKTPNKYVENWFRKQVAGTVEGPDFFPCSFEIYAFLEMIKCEKTCMRINNSEIMAMDPGEFLRELTISQQPQRVQFYSSDEYVDALKLVEDDKMPFPKQEFRFHLKRSVIQVLQFLEGVIHINDEEMAHYVQIVENNMFSKKKMNSKKRKKDQDEGEKNEEPPKSKIWPKLWRFLESNISLFQKVYKVRYDMTYAPLLQMENRENLLELMMNISTGVIIPLYFLQIPYYSIFKEMKEEFFKYGDYDAKLVYQIILAKFNHRFKAERHFHFLTSCYDDIAAADVLINLYDHWTINDANLLMVYDFTTGIWTAEESKINTIIGNYSSFLGKNGGLHSNYASNVNNLKNLMVCLESNSKLGNLYDFSILRSSSDHRLLFPNGYYDGLEDKFYPCYINEDNSKIFFTPQIFFFAQIADPLIDEVDPDIIELIKKKIFYSMHSEEVGDYYIESLALSIMGVPQKVFYVHLGDTNSGKSSETDFFRATFKGYAGTANTSVFDYIKNDSRSADQQNWFVVNLWWKRLVFLIEGSARVLNSEMIKSHSSGNVDPIEGRLQNKKAVIVIPKYHLYFFANHNFKQTEENEPAIISRARYYHYSKVYVEPHMFKDPSSQLIADVDVQEWGKDSVKRQHLMVLLLQYYQRYRRNNCTRFPVPETIASNNVENVGRIASTDEFMESLLFHFEVDGCENSQVTREQVREKCKEMNVIDNLFSTKLNNFLSHHGLKQYGTLFSKQVRKEGKRIYCWIGMKLRRPKNEGNQFNLPVLEGDYLTDLPQWIYLMTKYKGTIPEEVKGNLRFCANNFMKGVLGSIEEHTLALYGTEYQINVYNKNNRRNVVSLNPLN